MSTTMEFKVHFRSGCRGRKHIRAGETPQPKPVSAGKVPRVSRLMALAIRFDQLIESGKVRDYAEIARLGHVSRARISQITSMLTLAPDIQEALLNLPAVTKGRDPVSERHIRHVAAAVDWRKQRWLYGRISNK